MSDPRFPYLKKPKVGFLLGKFMPPHNGHVFMCEFARQYVDRLVILVGSLPSEPIPGELRFKWMKEMFPDCDVVWTNEILPQEPTGPDDDDFWAIWKRVCNSAMSSAHYDRFGNDNWNGPDIVFASEDYGHRLAKELGAEFVPVDMTRTAVPSSGTMMRGGPFDNWNYLPHVVRPYYVKRVTLFGPESTGKSTLAAGLSQHYQTIVAPEYGRTYTEVFGPEVDADDLRKIVQGHLATVTAAKRLANKILIEDTDPVMTAVWSDLLLVEGRDPWFDEYTDYADLYLLTDIDLPWVDDGTRYFKSESERRHFYEICEKELINRGVKFARVSGNGPSRLQSAIDAIDATFF